MVRLALAGILAPFLLSACIASNRRVDALAELVREYPCPSLPAFPYRGAEAILGEDARCSLVLAARDVAARQGFGPALPIDTARIVMASIEQPSRDRHPSLVAWTVRLAARTAATLSLYNCLEPTTYIVRRCRGTATLKSLPVPVRISTPPRPKRTLDT